MMENTFRKDHTILTSLCDAQGRLGVRSLFDLFMDAAAEHAHDLGVGYYHMLERNCYWVEVRTRVRLYARPKLGSRVSVETWPGRPGLAKSERYYRMLENDVIAAEARTEWAAQDTGDGSIRRMDSIGFPLELPFREEKLCPEPFRRFRPLQEGEELTYTVSSQDIDVGQHMNNVAYIRMLLGTFTTAELSEMNLAEAEISYRRACIEGETLALLRAREDDEWRFDVRRPDGELAAQAVLTTREGRCCSREISL